jgi:signal transduction histidine kinase
VLYQIYKEQANPAKALTYFERYKELNDSVFTVESNRAIASMEGRLVLERKQKEIEGLENESALQKKINYLGLAIILSMVAFTYFMVRSRKKLLNAYAQLEETNNSLIEIKRKVEMQADLLGKSNKTKDKIFSIVSHDLRSPMTALKGLFGLIENGQLSIEEFKALIPDLTRRVSHASDIMDELLQWSRSQLEVMETHPEVIDVKAMLQRKVLEWHEPAADKGVNIQVGDIPQDLKAWADPDMVKTVVRNLISNAIKFCRRNDSITLTARQEANFAQITVEDTGVGILSENLHRILNEHGFSTYGTAQEKGTGIGLMLCKEFIEKNGGKIWVESIPGSRTKFLFTLPLPR